MKTFVQFTEDIAQRRIELKQRSDANVKSYYDKIRAHKKSVEDAKERDQEKENLKKEIKKELATEVYDKDVMGSSQIRKTGGETIGKDRKQPASMTRKMKAVGGGKMEPEKSRARRKDAGQQKPKSQTQQQPTKDRGSAEVKQSYADKVKAERRAAALARRSGQTSTTSSSMSSKDAEKKATELLSKKSTIVKKEPSRTNRKWKHESGGGMTPKERASARNKERSAKLKAKKAELIKGFTDTHGRAPKGAEKTRLLGLAHKAAKSGS